jgi:SAM-dependent methyltransferase
MMKLRNRLRSCLLSEIQRVPASDSPILTFIPIHVMMDGMSEWWEEFYPRMYALLGDKIASEEQTTAETAWLLGRADLCSGASVLDVGCGPGRHAVALAAAGAQVLGLDVSEDLILAARAAATETGVENRTAFRTFDMRRLESLDAGPFDAVLLMDSVCGIFDTPVTADVLRQARGLLRPEGHLFLTQMDRARWGDCNEQYLCPLDDGSLLQRHFHFNEKTERIVDRVVVTDAATGRRDLLPNQSLRLYTDDELRDLLESAGFTSVDFCRDPDGAGTYLSEVYVHARQG